MLKFGIIPSPDIYKKNFKYCMIFQNGGLASIFEEWILANSKHDKQLNKIINWKFEINCQFNLISIKSFLENFRNKSDQ